MRRTFFITSSILLLVEGLSFAVFRHTTIQSIFALTIVGVIAVAAWSRPWVVVAAMIAELAIGGKGYLFALHWHGVWPIRILLFVMMIALVFLRYRSWKVQLPPRQLILWPMLLLVWVSWATIWGLMQGHPVRQVFLDMNAFLYLPVVGLWWAMMRSKKDRWDYLLTVLGAGVTVTALLGLFLTVVFGSSWSQAPEIYSWIWFSKTGEIAMIGSHTYRVFLQSQIIGLLMGILLLGLPKTSWKTWWWIPLIAGMTSTMLSLSRSFWLGAIFGGIALLLVLWKQRENSLLTLRRGGIALIVSLLLVNWAVNFPNPIPGLGQRNQVSARLTDIGGAQAATARLNQIEPLLDAISLHPIIGRGFGTEVTFFSPDPRSQGLRTATAFELGYLDWWLDMGAIGIVLVGGWGIALLRAAWRRPEYRGITATIITLFAVHLTTLYLNFPIGLGWLGLMTVILYDHE